MIPRLRLVATALALFVSVAGPTSAAAQDWNAGSIRWRPFAVGLAEARTSGLPVCLVVSTEWCPHCRTYARVFHDPRVVAAAKGLVMIHVDKDADPESAAFYAPDGDYIPRTLFLDSAAKLRPEIHAARTKYRHFFDEADASQLLEAMAAAKKGLPRRK